MPESPQSKTTMVEDVVESMISHPRHYNRGDQEVIDIIADQCRDVDGYKGFLMGNIIKYVCRHPHKGTASIDLQKAEFYLKRLLVDYGRTPEAT